MKTIQERVETLEEIVSVLRKECGRACILGGGTDEVAWMLAKLRRKKRRLAKKVVGK